MILPEKPVLIMKSRFIGALLFFFSLAGFALQLSAVRAEEQPQEVIAGIIRNFPPDYSFDEETGKPVGFAIDVMDEVAKNAGLHVRYVVFDEWSLANKALREGHIDVIPGMSLNEERKKDMDFTHPYEAFRICIFVRDSTTDIRGIDDLRGRNVAMGADSIGLLIMQEYGKARPVISHSLDEALVSLLSGNADALVYPEPPVLLIVRKTGLQERIKIAGKPLREVKRAIAVGKGKTGLLDKLDKAVQAVIATPKYRAIYAKWYVAPEPYWNARHILIAAGFLLALVILIFATGHYLALRRLNRDLKSALKRQEKAEASLRESELRHRHLIESSHDWIWEVDDSAVYTYASPRIKELLGYEPEEVIGKTLFDLMPDDEAKRVKQIFTAIAAERRPFRNLENCNRHKDGTPVILETNGAPIIDDTGAFLGYRGTDRDITERKRAEGELRRAKSLLDKTFASLNEAIFVIETNTRKVIACNSAVEDIFGYDKNEVIGANTEFLHVDRSWYERLGRELLPALDRDGVYRTEFKNRRKDGSVFPTETTVTEILDDLGQRTAVVSVIRDITERKRAEEDRLQLAAAIEQSGEMVVMTDKEGIIQYVNPAFEQITGYTCEEAVGKNPRILKSGKQGFDFYKELWETLTAGGTWKGHFVNKRKDGGFFEEDATISPVKNSSGETTHFVAVKRDATEQLKTEKQLYQAQKMEAIGTMAGGIAHDFNNILGAISGYTEISLLKIPSDSRIKYYLEQIHASCQRAINLVRQILEFSRLTEKERTPVSLIPLIKETIKMLREIIPATIEIRLNAKTDADTILGDATQIYQILMNLCTNAYQAMKDKGGLLEVDLVRIAVGEVAHIDDKLRGLNPGSYLELIVKDTGEGIDPLIRERIFDPFFTTKKIGEGTGLGLSVVHGIVRSYGGKITVESRIGQGSAFHVYLPLLVEKQEASPREPDQPDMDGKGRILVVDDETMLANMMTEMLANRGYAVIARTNSVDALETFRADPDRFDLVITDQTMPEMTGIDLAGNIMSIRPDIPVILCTGFIDSSIEEKTTEAGIRGILLKPVSMKRLIALIRDLLAPAS